MWHSAFPERQMRLFFQLAYWVTEIHSLLEAGERLLFPLCVRKWIASGPGVRLFLATTGSVSLWFTHRSVSVLSVSYLPQQHVWYGCSSCNHIIIITLTESELWIAHREKKESEQHSHSLSLLLGCHSCCLHLFLCLSNWSTVSWPHPWLPRSWPWPVRPRFHLAAVLLLLWLA